MSNKRIRLTYAVIAFGSGPCCRLPCTYDLKPDTLPKFLDDDPPQHVSIDESMVGTKNRIAYLQYIKKFELCHAISGYVFYIKLYAGKDFASNNRSVVMDLMRKYHLLNKGYHLFTDNLYTKPLLARILDTEGTLLTGTVRSNSKGLPAIPAKLNVGQIAFLFQQSMDSTFCISGRDDSGSTAEASSSLPFSSHLPSISLFPARLGRTTTWVYPRSNDSGS